MDLPCFNERLTNIQCFRASNRNVKLTSNRIYCFFGKYNQNIPANMELVVNLFNIQHYILMKVHNFNYLVSIYLQSQQLLRCTTDTLANRIQFMIHEVILMSKKLWGKRSAFSKMIFEKIAKVHECYPLKHLVIVLLIRYSTYKFLITNITRKIYFFF